MCALFSRRGLLAVFTALVAAAFLIAAVFDPPTGVLASAQRIWSAGSIVIFLLFLLGESPAFPLACRWTPLGRWLPPLDGEWAGEVTSNWPLISGRIDPAATVAPGSMKAVGVRVKIKARLFRIHVSLISDDRYSSSSTAAAAVSRHPDTNAITLAYVYENKTSLPIKGDSSFHQGAAVLVLENGRNPTDLRGLYWTNRNWTEGKNTAGHITLHNSGRLARRLFKK